MIPTKKIDDLNLHFWFKNLITDEIIPEHFIICKIPVKPEVKFWIYEFITGRYAFYSKTPGYDLGIAFEDPSEALMYELTWG